MFITLPKVFASLGSSGAFVGMAFFLLVIFAAATSAISLYEACVASVCDLLKLERKAATFFTGALILSLSTFSALGYGAWSKITLFGMQFLDFFDFITNSVLMPIVAAVTCIFVGWVLKPRAVVEECESGGTVMKAKAFYSFMVRYLAPALMVALLISEVCRALKIGGWSI
jgi:NSS family neurotransmitter:Na+ symporter